MTCHLVWIPNPIFKRRHRSKDNSPPQGGVQYGESMSPRALSIRTGLAIP
jgi:hypothetical protein